MEVGGGARITVSRVRIFPFAPAVLWKANTEAQLSDWMKKPDWFSRWKKQKSRILSAHAGWAAEEGQGDKLGEDEMTGWMIHTTVLLSISHMENSYGKRRREVVAGSLSKQAAPFVKLTKQTNILTPSAYKHKWGCCHEFSREICTYQCKHVNLLHVQLAFCLNLMASQGPIWHMHLKPRAAADSGSERPKPFQYEHA